MLYYKGEGHKVISLSQLEGTGFNPFLKSHGIETHSYKVQQGAFFFIRHLVHFITFCKHKKIDIVFSHLEPANFVASIGQYFAKAKVYLCRHHIDEAALYKYNSSWSYKITNKLARKMIVVSAASLKYMVEVENVPERKLIHINLAYDFNLFKIPTEAEKKSIKSPFKNRLLIVTACRLTRFKRPELSIEVLTKLLENGVDAHLILLGNGEMFNELNADIAAKGLQNNVSMLGHVDNVLDYLAIADFILHPSVLESSCVVIKEAGLVKKPVIVCKGIGDFDEYIQDMINGFAVDRDQFVDQASEVIITNFRKKEFLAAVGTSLWVSIDRIFNVKNIAQKYHLLLQK